VLAELLAEPGVVEVCTLRSSFGFLALHGGSVEKVTDHIAITAAERAGASLYALIQGSESGRHVPASQMSPNDSSVLAAFLAHVDVVVSIHGFGVASLWQARQRAVESGDDRHLVFAKDLPYAPDRALLLGGSNRALAGDIAVHLREALSDYHPVDELSLIPRQLRGLHPRNPVNLPSMGGVQIECCPDVRGLGPGWWGKGTPEAPHPPETERLIDALTAVASKNSR